MFRREPPRGLRSTVRLAAGAALLIGASGPLSAQTAADPAANQANGDAQVEISNGLSLTKTSDMDFGRIVRGGAGGVILDPAETVTCTASANLVALDDCTAAAFVGTARPGARIIVRKPARRRFTVTGPGGATMRVRRVSIGHHQGMNRLTAANRRNVRFRITDPAGDFSFQMGGELRVGANQPAGEYVGTFDVEIQYR